MARDMDTVLRQYLRFVKPSYDDFIFPTKKYADLLIPRAAQNEVAVDLIVQHLSENMRRPRRPSISHTPLMQYQELSN
ncbi:uridine kinase [Fonticula alba]|uniref:Uridine kinase n=1 Tax=Fonticula alba TaxID=691883 RepID=A0A058Z865_FONAL|nr:uridine kinase [Fonticula alba]KCV70316.1 uridine kinase [Fonticula alba]|eukprot:XP_009494832.1 uridine kinase [Fonticula alba]